MKKIILITLLFTFISSLCAREESFASFAYHRFGDSRYPSTNIKLSVFEKQLKYFQVNNYQILTLSKALEILKKEGGFSQKTAVITIDDGYKSFYKNGFPLLKKYDFKATLFINPGLIGGKDQMNWDDVRIVKDYGIEIGNHSAYHPYFLESKNFKQIETDFRNDLKISEKIFAEKINLKPKTYCYPFGEYSQKMTKILEENNYLGAAAQNSGVPSINMNFYEIPRFPMGGVYANMKGFEFKVKVKPLHVSNLSIQEHLVQNNPPELILNIETGNLHKRAMQCFIGDSKADFEVLSQNPFKVKIKADEKLSSRRTLYKLTVPSPDMKTWYWFSWLWVKI